MVDGGWFPCSDDGQGVERGVNCRHSPPLMQLQRFLWFHQVDAEGDDDATIILPGCKAMLVWHTTSPADNIEPRNNTFRYASPSMLQDPVLQFILQHFNHTQGVCNRRETSEPEQGCL